jgi:CBS domain-containing protein
MKVADVMMRRVISISPDSSIFDAIKLMLRRRISGLPVLDQQGRLIGIVSEGDLLRRPEVDAENPRFSWLDALLGPHAAADDYVRSHGVRVRDVMTSRVVTIDKAASVRDAVILIEQHRVRRLPVLDGERVVGMIGRADIIRAVAEAFRRKRPGAQPDEVIRARILDEMRKHSWMAETNVEVAVRHGVADLWGTISDVAQRDALRVLVESTPGVRDVHDHLSWKATPYP